MLETSPLDLAKFEKAQAQQQAGYEKALAELREGAKKSHWIWYVFPQIEGLGRSAAAQRFALADLSEARQYLRHEVLGPRYLESAEAVLEQLHHGVELPVLFDSGLDAAKFVSSLTLFELALNHTDMTSWNEAKRAQALFTQLWVELSARGYSRCRFTLDEVS